MFSVCFDTSNDSPENSLKGTERIWSSCPGWKTAVTQLVFYRCTGSVFYVSPCRPPAAPSLNEMPPSWEGSPQSCDHWWDVDWNRIVDLKNKIGRRPVWTVCEKPSWIRRHCFERLCGLYAVSLFPSLLSETLQACDVFFGQTHNQIWGAAPLCFHLSFPFFSRQFFFLCFYEKRSLCNWLPAKVTGAADLKDVFFTF